MDRKVYRTSLWVLFSIYLSFLLGNLLIFRLINLLQHGFNYYYYDDDGFSGGFINTHTIMQNANIIPFKTIWLFVKSYSSNYFNFSILFYNILLNIGAFIPLGLLLPLMFRSMMKFRYFIMKTSFMLLVIELLQLLLHLGQFDIDDVILNSMGAIIGFVLFSTILKNMKLE